MRLDVLLRVRHGSFTATIRFRVVASAAVLASITALLPAHTPPDEAPPKWSLHILVDQNATGASSTGSHLAIRADNAALQFRCRNPTREGSSSPVCRISVSRRG